MPENVKIEFSKVQYFALRCIILEYFRHGEVKEWFDVLSDSKTTIEEMLYLVMGTK